MSRTSQLDVDDACRMLGVIEAARQDDPGPALPWALMQGLQDLMPAGTDICYRVYDIANKRWKLGQDLGPGGVLHLWEDAHPSDPLAAERLCPPSAVMVIPLPATLECQRRLVFLRFDDTERDRQVAELLRPHLQEIWLDAERRRAGVPCLTPREWEVLGLTAAGLTFAEVAARLFISVGTVRRHVERVRERLAVHSAAAAAAKAMPHAPGRRRVPAPRAVVHLTL